MTLSIAHEAKRCYVECLGYKPIMLSVIMLSVIIASVEAPALDEPQGHVYSC